MEIERMETTKKICIFVLIFLIICNVFYPIFINAAEISEESSTASSDYLNQQQAGAILAEFAKKFCNDHASETLYGFAGRYNAYKGIKTQNATWNGVNYGPRYQFDCVGWICFAVHQSLKLGGENYTEFAVPPGGGNIPYFVNGFECIKGNYTNAYSTLTRDEVEKTLQPGDILFCANGGPHVVLYVGDGKIVHSYHITLKCESLYDNSTHYTDYCAIGRITQDTASKIKRSNTTIEFGKVTGGIPINITSVKKSINGKTNKDVKVTITADNEIASVKGSTGWTIDGKTAYKIYKNKADETVSVTSSTGNSSGSEKIEVDIDKKVEDLFIYYTPDEEDGKTNKDVTVEIMCKDEELQKIDGWTLTGGNKTLKKSFSENTNGDIYVQVKDTVGNISKQKININWIDKVKPTIKNESTNKISNTQVKVTLELSEAVNITSGKGAKITPINQAKTKYNIIYTSNCTDTLTIKDEAGNSITKSITINQIDGEVDIGEPVFNTKNPTNQNVTVTITANEDIIIKNSSDRWKLNGRTITGIYETNAAKETITVEDNAGNTKKITIPEISNIDKEAPGVVKHSEIISADGNNVTVNIVFNESISLVEGTGWNKITNTEKVISKTFLKSQIEAMIENNTQELIKVKDLAGNEYQFKINPKLVDNNITIEILDAIPPILKKITYGTKKQTRDNIEVQLEVNEEVNIPEGWNIKEGSENTWILYRTYTNNTVNTEAGIDGDYVAITDFAGNKIVGDSTTKSSVNNGNVCISINNIDRIAPIVKESQFTEKDGQVLVQIQLSEYVKEKGDWNSAGAPYQNTILKQLNKNDIVTFDVTDFTNGNTTTLTVDVANEKVSVLPRVALIEQSTKATKDDVTVKIVINKEPQSVEGWSVSKGQDGQENYEGRWILEKTYLQNTNDEGEYVLITDQEGNFAVGNNVENGKVHITVTNIDREELKVNKVYTSDVNGNNDIICIEFNKNINKIINGDWNINYLEGKLNTIYKKFTSPTTEPEKITVRDGVKNILDVEVSVEYDEVGNKYIATANGNSSEYTDTLKRIEIKQINENNNTIYYQGDILNVDGLTITAIYEDETSESGEKSVDIVYGDGSGIEIAKEGYSPQKSILLTQTGNQKRILVYYEGKSAWFYVTVRENKIAEYEINVENAEKNYTVGDELNTEGVIVYQKYSNGTKTQIVEDIVFSPTKLDKVGNQIISVTYEGEEIGEFTVYVTEDDINIVSFPKKQKYNLNDLLDITGLNVEKIDTNGNKIDITEEVTAEPTELTEKGTHTIVLKYKGVEIGEYEVDVEKAVKEIKISDSQEKITIYEGEDVNLKNLKVIVIYEDGEEEEITVGYKYSDILYNENNEPIIKVSYGGKTVDLPITILENKVTELKLIQKPTKLEYYIGDTLDVSGIKLKAIYANGNSEELNEDDSIIWTPSTLRTAGTQTIKVEYEEQSVNFEVTVNKQNNIDDDEIKDDKKSDGDNDTEEKKDNSNDNKEDEKDNLKKGDNKETKDSKTTENINDNVNKDNTTAPQGYKDANTAKSKLPQTGVKQMIFAILVICAIVSGGLYIKYRKI